MQTGQLLRIAFCAGVIVLNAAPAEPWDNTIDLPLRSTAMILPAGSSKFHLSASPFLGVGDNRTRGLLVPSTRLRMADESKFAAWGRQASKAALRASLISAGGFGREFVYQMASARLTPFANDRAPVRKNGTERRPAKTAGVPIAMIESLRPPVVPETPSEWATITLLGILAGVFGLASFRAPPGRYPHAGKRE